MNQRTDEFSRGKAVIRDAIYTALRGKGIRDSSVSFEQSGSDRDAPLGIRIVAGGREITVVISRHQVEDSAQTIDPVAAAKIRTAVDQIGR